MTRLAVYTTIYPGVEPFLRDWCQSVQEQTDKNFQLWIGSDAVTVDAAKGAMGADPKAIWVVASSGDTPAQVRQRALERIVDACDAVVLVDSDDVLHSSRVASARAALEASDLVACALRLVDAEGVDLGMTLGLPPDERPSDVLPRHNVFGLSNSSFRSELLRRCLPIPVAAELVDWFLATRAWLRGARLAFDPERRMDYRQHGSNMTRVRPPFSPEQVWCDTERVCRHFQIVRSVPLPGCRHERLAELERVAADIETFRRWMAQKPARLDRYTKALNALQPAPYWWSSVAHPALRHIWDIAESQS